MNKPVSNWEWRWKHRHFSFFFCVGMFKPPPPPPNSKRVNMMKHSFQVGVSPPGAGACSPHLISPRIHLKQIFIAWCSRTPLLTLNSLMLSIGVFIPHGEFNKKLWHMTSPHVHSINQMVQGCVLRLIFLPESTCNKYCRRKLLLSLNLQLFNVIFWRFYISW